MGFKNGAYATYWGGLSYNNKGVPSARIAVSAKNKQTNEYDQTFGGFVRFVGNAKNKVASLQERTRIRILECDVLNLYNKETKVTSWYPIIYDFELADGNGAPAPQSHAQATPQHRAQSAPAPQAAPMPQQDEEDLPF